MNHGVVEVFAYQETLLMMAVFGIAILAMIWVGFRRWLQYKEKMGRLIAEQTAERAAQYGAQIVERVNFARNRVKPSFSLDGSLGTEVWRHDSLTLRIQADAANLTNRLNVIDFAGLFSGNAVAPPRSFALRLDASF